MSKIKKFFTSSIILMLVFLCLFSNTVNANFFTDDDDKDNTEQSEIEKTIDDDDGGIFEKVIAKMIGGIAETVFSLTTNESFGMGFKNYDELIFSKDYSAISPFTDEQWNTMISWYKVMSTIAGCLILIVVVIVAYKFIIGGYSIDKRNDAKDSILRLFFGMVAMGFAPFFVKFLLFLNNNLVSMLVGYSEGSLDNLLGNSLLTNVQTGNAIATAIVIAMFAYLFVKLNIKFIIRQFTILIFTLFTPIVVIMWMINKRAIGASIWFGEILINVFMQFIYAFLFLVYMKFLPQSGGWAISLLWAMMILPIADSLQNTLQNLISRVAGIDNEDLANRGIGMAGAMAYSVRAISYQFKNPQNQVLQNNTSFLGRLFNNETTQNPITPMQTNKMEQTPINKTPINVVDTKQENNSNNVEKYGQASINKSNGNIINNQKQSFGNKAYNVGKEVGNIGMYMAEGRNFSTRRNYERYNINNTRKEDYKQKNNQNNMIANMKDTENND